MRYVIVFCVSLCFVSVSHQKSTPEDDSYVAAILEYQFTRNTTQNLHNYLDYIRQAAEKNADVLVFPEMTLTRGDKIKVPIHGLLKEHPIPALRPDLYNEILVSLSAAARQHEIYVLVNLQEEMDCRDAPGEYCPEEKTYVFNTNVVFDRTGAIIDRYRKINLFGEYTRHPALRPELGLFSTDFGVTFGHFICFDIMFQVPATQVVQKHNLTDVLYSTMWFSEMPFLTAVQTQQEYAYTMNINLIGANANNVKVATAGSGIYSGNAGALVSVMPGVPSSHLLVARVPKKPGQVTYKYHGPIFDDPKNNQLFLNKDLTLPAEISRELTPGFQEFTLADKGVSCRFRVKTRVNAPEGSQTIPKYRAFVKDGANTYAKRHIGVVYCAIVACKDDTATSCPYKFSKDEMFTEFEELEISMTTYSYQHNSTLDCDNVVYYPTSLRNNKFPLQPLNYTFTKSKNGAERLDVCSQNGVNTNGGNLYNDVLENSKLEDLSYKLNSAQNEIVSFGIWGRLYNRDVNPVENVSEEDVNNYIEIENVIFNAADKYSTD
ncbi:vanin-like protein 2 isoform X1 [Ostrinia furnacalis]|uniref:vanin-like protein 2 isoform X1 n=1 Tax=Ostrinia furnacalis TaxID=93504 RepID=UPI001040996C|nr:vanin-like protein 2 isoform X1 [Ostrinia furnacalis]